MSNKIFFGRSDGIGNRVEQIIRLEYHCEKHNEKFDYLWNNQNNRKDRQYPFFLKSKNVNIIDYDPEKRKHSVYCGLEGASIADVLCAAKNIEPTFHISFEKQPIGIHIRGTDRVDKHKNPIHFINNYDLLYLYIEKIATDIKEKHSITQPIFVCSDEERLKNRMKELLSEYSFIEPIVEETIPREFVDFFGLSKCKEIYLCGRYSTFSICAAQIGNIPLNCFHSKLVVTRHKGTYKIIKENLDVKQKPETIL